MANRKSIIKNKHAFDKWLKDDKDVWIRSIDRPQEWTLGYPHWNDNHYYVTNDNHANVIKDFLDDKGSICGYDFGCDCHVKIFGLPHYEYQKISITKEEILISGLHPTFRYKIIPKRWRACHGGNYFFINYDLQVIKTFDSKSSIDDNLWKVHNYYKTRDEAEKHAELVKEAYKQPEN